MEFRKHFGYDVEKASEEAAVSFVGVESLTVQSMAEDADINVIVARFGITGQMPVNPRVPMYGDFTGLTDYQDALRAVSEAYDGFMQLPASLRLRFHNNPQELLDFCANDANIEEARKLGLLKEDVDGKSVGAASGANSGRSEPGGSSTAPGGAQSGKSA